jgi:HAD superfamily hydrolase (TIGR01450 family)
MHNGVPRAAGLQSISAGRDAILSDVWGVVHNGVEAFAPACEALMRYRKGGGVVVLITNAPRPREPVIDQLRSLGVPDETYDDIVTSGDVTRELIRRTATRIVHIGPPRDRRLFDGLDVELSAPANAQAIVCTGLDDDRTETPQDYAARLADLHAFSLPMICANPDIVVEYGDRLLWCAGALARDYAALGGRTLIAGKPHAPIYARARELAAQAAGRPIADQRILAIGDGVSTDISGARDAGLDVLFISGGIHAGEYGGGEADPVALARFFAEHSVAPVGWLPRLSW